ncbi:hypothetical protein AMR72_05480 [Flavobacterium psychrophilum]|nr:hypothetical protein AMR72_05480 [Flavobacterium psychrophilum]AOE52015.1 hypothetical protein ALW18_05475 [Flavobacterium psychrophilum]
MKLLLLTAGLFIASLSLQAQETVYRSEIPSGARSLLSKFRSPFHHAVKQDTEEATIYNITLNDKTEIKFADNGSLTVVDGKGKPIPYKFLDKTIVEYMKENYANDSITRVEMCDSECKLALSNGKALKFDSSGKFIANN